MHHRRSDAASPSASSSSASYSSAHDAAWTAAAADVATSSPAASSAPALLFTEAHRRELAELGYTIVRGVLSASEAAHLHDAMWDFYTRLKPGLRRGHRKTYAEHWPANSHSIMKHFGCGHTRFAWECRQHPRVVQVFSELWQVNATDLLCSFDGNCLMPGGREYTDNSEKDTLALVNHWTHTDQGDRFDFQCAQGLVNLESTDYDGAGGLLVYPRSHRCHQGLFEHCRLAPAGNFQIYPTAALKALTSDARPFFAEDDPLRHASEPVPLRGARLRLLPGDVALFDSRCAHQNVSPTGHPTHDRAVQYVCMLPRERGYANLGARIHAFEHHMTTNHWADRAFTVPSLPSARYAGRTPTGDASSLLVQSKDELTPLGRRLVGYEE